MSEIIINIEPYSPTDIFGIQNNNINLLRELYPKLKIIARDQNVIVLGQAEETEEFRQLMDNVMNHFDRYGKIDNGDIKKLASGNYSGEESDTKDTDSNVLVYGRSGNVIRSRTVNQHKMVSAIKDNDMLFAIGPAGTGKTYTAVALAVRALKNKEVKRIILTRPAVEAGENLGFLPGDLKEKLDPYLRPLYDALQDMLPPNKLLSYIDEGVIEIAPLAFMRGRTLEKAFVILDEAQNCTLSQLKLFLTRMGRMSKFIITGDITQIDLPKKSQSGLLYAQKTLGHIKGISFVWLDSRDVIRHALVTDIIDAFDKYETLQEQANDKKVENKNNEPK